MAVATAMVEVLPALVLEVAAAPQGRCGDPAQRPWCHPQLSPDERADRLLAALSEDERIQLLGGDVIGAGPHTGASRAIPRLGIPPVYYSDGPLGPRQGPATAVPAPLALAATFDPRWAAIHGTEVADEVAHKGNDAVFAPTVNIMRTPQGGRSYEAYGEDPYLVARTTVAWIQGAQSHGVIATVKHFAANNQEGQVGVPPLTGIAGGRFLVDAKVDERSLREIYFPQFEAAVRQAKVGIVMCAYNRVNGRYACENPHLLGDVLKKEWDFEGYVLSDYGAAHDTAGSMRNGLDFEPFPGLTYSPAAIRAALAVGSVTQHDVDEHVRRILRTLFAFGFFDRPAYVADDRAIDVVGHAAIAEQLEEHAITLLRNRHHLLPLDAAHLHSIAVIGPYANRFVTGGGSGNVTPFTVTTTLAAIRQRVGPRVAVGYDEGSDPDRAAAIAARSDVAVVVVGDVESEGEDKSCLGLNCASDLTASLPPLSSCAEPRCPPNGLDQDRLIERVASANPHTVVVLETGAPVLTPWRDRVAALLEAWYPGEEGGVAIARVLFGDVDPAGRLPVTFPRSPEQLPTAGDPTSYPGVDETEYYREGVLVGYRWYDAHHLEPAFPFGYGLSYTTFRFDELQLAAGGAGDAVATVSVRVTNTGRRRGVAVPELYLSLPAPAPTVPQPPRQLRGYAKVVLEPGQSAVVSFPLNDRSFAYWDVASGWRIAPGCYRVAVGGSDGNLPLSGAIARGGLGCGSAALALPGGARPASTLPLPALPAVAVASAQTSGAVAASSAAWLGLPATGHATSDRPVAPLLGLLVTLVMAGAGLGRRRRGCLGRSRWP